MELKAGTVFAGYRIEEVVGRGGMGVVYRATHLKLEATRALKVIAPDLASDVDFQARFAREARAAASLDHPSVIPIYDAGEEDGIPFIAMRFVVGTDLESSCASGARSHRRSSPGSSAPSRAPSMPRMQPAWSTAT